MNLRNLERIEETTTSGKTRAWTVTLAVLGSAAVASATMAMSGSGSAPRAADRSDDPLAELVRSAHGEKIEAKAPEVSSAELSYPDLLSDQEHPTTALVAVRNAKGELIPAPAEAPSVPTLGPPEALDRLPVVPLPAGNLLQQTSVTGEPKDELLRIAVAKADASSAGDSLQRDPTQIVLDERGPETSAERPALAAAGTPTEEGFALQLASFKNQAEADELVEELRKRGHAAYRQAANVPERGLWHRVRIGPFKTKYAAELYKRNLSDQERISALLIDPEKAERADKVRAERLAERIRKFGAP